MSMTICASVAGTGGLAAFPARHQRWGRIEREYGLGRGALDLLISWGDEQHPIEVKLRRDTETETDALYQLARYLGQLGLTEGWLVGSQMRFPLAPMGPDGLAGASEQSYRVTRSMGADNTSWGRRGSFRGWVKLWAFPDELFLGTFADDPPPGAVQLSAPAARPLVFPL